MTLLTSNFNGAKTFLKEEKQPSNCTNKRYTIRLANNKCSKNDTFFTCHIFLKKSQKIWNILVWIDAYCPILTSFSNISRYILAGKSGCLEKPTINGQLTTVTDNCTMCPDEDPMNQSIQTTELRATLKSNWPLNHLPIHVQGWNKQLATAKFCLYRSTIHD